MALSRFIEKRLWLGCMLHRRGRARVAVESLGREKCRYKARRGGREPRIRTSQHSTSSQRTRSVIISGFFLGGFSVLVLDGKEGGGLRWGIDDGDKEGEGEGGRKERGGEGRG